MAYFGGDVIRKIRNPGRLKFPAGYTPSPIERISTISEGTCLSILNEVVIPNLSSTPPAFEGAGVVTCAGGSYLRLAYASIRKLRELNPTIPVQIWHLNQSEVDGKERKFDDLNVQFRNCQPFFESEFYRTRTGWSSKSVAVMQSPFQNVLFMDADCYPLVDPVTIFEHSDYEAGLLVFPDGKQCRDSNRIFNALGIRYEADFWEWEAGQFLVDKVEHWKAIQLYAWMSSHAYLFHNLLHGDKDTLPLAAIKLEEEFVTASRPDWIESGFIHKLTDGTPVFHHMLSPKRDPVDPPADIQGFYEEYDSK